MRCQLAKETIGEVSDVITWSFWEEQKAKCNTVAFWINSNEYCHNNFNQLVFRRKSIRVLVA